MPNIRRVNQSDSKDIFDWRNDELTRQMSHTTEAVEWVEHSKWFSSLLTNQNRLLLMCEDESLNEKVAIVRFDVAADRALISINCSPSMRGRGKAKCCLKDAIEYFKTIYTKIRYIDAEIRSVNIASQRSFVGVGFVLVRENVDGLFYEFAI